MRKISMNNKATDIAIRLDIASCWRKLVTTVASYGKRQIR